MSTKEDLQQVHRMMTENRAFEKRIGHDRLIEWSRLPSNIIARHGLKRYTYKLTYGMDDDNAYISYCDEKKPWSDKHKVLLHYEESTLKECISKAWRNLAENRVKL